MKRPIKPICADAPKRGLSLLPYGLYLNKAILKAAAGDILTLGQEWNKQKRVLLRKCKIDLNSSLGTFVVKYLYGEKMRVEDIFKQWGAVCEVEGFGKNAIGDVYLLATTPYDAEVEEIEDELVELETRKEELRRQLKESRENYLRIMNYEDK